MQRLGVARRHARGRNSDGVIQVDASIIGRDLGLLSRFSVSVASENLQAKNIMITTPGTHPRESRFGGRTVTFRSLRSEDKELFKNFIRSLPRKDNYYLMVDVYDDQAIDRWMNRVESGEIIGVIALDGNQMIGYCNLHTNNLPWTRHVADVRMSVSVAHRSRGVGTALASEAFAIGWARGLQKLLARMASGQLGALKLFHSLGFRTQAILTGCVKNENGVTENLVIMSHDRPLTA
jgi:ribosomal protein S18 acetylase RimI-like enzyme